MAGSTDPDTVKAEMQGAQSPTDAPPEDWDGDATPEADDEKESKKSDLDPAFAIEVPTTDDPLEFHAQLLKTSITGGQQGLKLAAHFEAPWTEVLNIGYRAKRSLDIKFGNVVAPGQFGRGVINTDADGAMRLKVDFTFPESSFDRFLELSRLTGKGGPLTIEPNQLSLDSLLTKRAEDDDEDTEPAGTFTDA